VVVEKRKFIPKNPATADTGIVEKPYIAGVGSRSRAPALSFCEVENSLAMPKFLVGCLVVVAVLVVGGGTAGYFFVIKPAWNFASEMGQFAEEYQSLNAEVERTGPYSPGADARLDSEQFGRFLVAQSEMRTGMELRLAELEEKWQAMKADMDQGGGDLNIVEMVTAYRDLGGLLLEAKRNQVQALNRHEFSLQEWAWVRNRAYQALGEEVAVASFGEQAPAQFSRQVSDEEIAMVSEHREALMEGYALAWFGL